VPGNGASDPRLPWRGLSSLRSDGQDPARRWQTAHRAHDGKIDAAPSVRHEHQRHSHQEGKSTGRAYFAALFDRVQSSN
jgi:hypothetical protein